MAAGRCRCRRPGRRLHRGGRRQRQPPQRAGRRRRRARRPASRRAWRGRAGGGTDDGGRPGAAGQRAPGLAPGHLLPAPAGPHRAGQGVHARQPGRGRRGLCLRQCHPGHGRQHPAQPGRPPAVNQPAGRRLRAGPQHTGGAAAGLSGAAQPLRRRGRPDARRHQPGPGLGRRRGPRHLAGRRVTQRPGPGARQRARPAHRRLGGVDGPPALRAHAGRRQHGAGGQPLRRMRQPGCAGTHRPRGGAARLGHRRRRQAGRRRRRAGRRAHHAQPRRAAGSAGTARASAHRAGDRHHRPGHRRRRPAAGRRRLPGPRLPLGGLCGGLRPRHLGAAARPRARWKTPTAPRPPPRPRMSSCGCRRAPR